MAQRTCTASAHRCAHTRIRRPRTISNCLRGWLAALLPALAGIPWASAGLEVAVSPAAPAGGQVLTCYDGHDRGPGNTSVAFDLADIYKWSAPSIPCPFPHESFGYFTPAGVEIAYIKRDRDLGQTFLCPGNRPVLLDAITLRTGPGTNAIRRSAYGRAVSLQLFRVTGTPILHDNGTPAGTPALHGWPHDRAGRSIESNRDDYYSGEVYTTLAIARGGAFPARADFGLPADHDADPGDPAVKLRYLRWKLTGADRIRLEPGQRYAFLVMLDEPAADAGFALANHYHGRYDGGHAIRRDGNGQFPPTPADPARDFKDPANAAAHASAHFPADFTARAAIAPGTNGYPDVDTWRDLSFWIEVSPVPRP